MAVGKNSGLKQASKKGGKKKVVNPFSKKDWYDVKAPAQFATRQIGKTPVTRTTGTKIASDGLRGRVFETSLGDLNNNEDSFRKFRLIIEETQGKTCLTNFHGMDTTTDKLRSMIKKKQSTIEAFSDVKTSDGYTLRVFAIAFTTFNKSTPREHRDTAYAQHTKVKAIRRKMIEIINKEVSGSDLKQVVSKLIPDSIAKDIEKYCSYIYPLTDVHIRKVKVVKRPKFDLGRLMDMHGESGASRAAATAAGEAGQRVDRPDNYEPPVQDSV
jgi:small subunit ribosomal protein S3Ae